MYHESMIAKLSKTQVQNLLKGKSARIKHGKHHKLHLLPHQMEGLHKKHALGKAYTLKFTQYQITKHGSGLMQDVYNFVKRNPYIKNAVNSGIRAGKKHLHHGVNYLTSKAHHYVERIPTIGDGIHHRRRRGRGLGGMALSGAGELAGAIGGPGSGEAKAVLQTLGNIGNFLGLGIKGKRTGPKRKATPAQLAALARGRATRDANRQNNQLHIGNIHKRKATQAQIHALTRARAARQLKKSGGALYVA